jgi:hypothetical protein
MSIFVILLLIVLAAMLIKLRSSSANPGSTGHARAVTKRKIAGRGSTAKACYSAVTINPAVQACAAVQALQSERFLVGETPHLPVLGCTSPNCGCKYMHHSERRDEVDRRDFLAHSSRLSQEGSEKSERRGRCLRRESDVSPEEDNYDWVLDVDWDAEDDSG